MKRVIAILLLVFFCATLYGGELKKLTVEQLLMGKSDPLFTRLPFISDWADNLHYFQFIDGKLFKVNAKTGVAGLFMASPKESVLDVNTLFPQFGGVEHTADYKKFLVEKDGNINLFQPEKNTLIPLITSETSQVATGGEELLDTPRNPTFSADGNSFAYTLKGDLYVYDITAAKNIRLTTDGSTEIFNGFASWVYYEEILGRASQYKAFWWSPDNQRIAFMRFDQSQVKEFAVFRDSGDYGNWEKTRYPKPGYPNPTVKIGIADITTKTIEWIDVQEKQEHYLAHPVWNEKGNKLFFQYLNRGQDDLKILCYEVNSKTLKPIYEEQQKTWVDLLDEDDFYLLKNDDLLIRSSKDGWYHLYYISNQGVTRQITTGLWSVKSIEAVNQKTQDIFFSAAKEDSNDQDLYKIGFNGKKIERLTAFKGSHRVKVSPDGGYFIDTYSSIDTPSRMELRDNRGRLIRPLGDSDTPLRASYEISKVKAELLHIKTEDGYLLPAVWYLPPDFDRTKKYPVVITVYGGPNNPIVANSYGEGYRGGLIKFFMAQEGIINLFVDHRGSGHFGKKGMDQMYRQLGKWELNDYIETVKYLRTLPFIDSEKIGIAGHSYGGYVTAYALTCGGDYFKYGIAASPVTDWRLYDSVYSERYMDTPQENPDGYKNSAAMSYVDKYQGQMRLTHGTLDDNVHPQNTMQLLETILDAGKNVELMLYPSSRHGVGGKKAMEYNRSNINYWLKHFFGRTIEPTPEKNK